MGGEVWSEGQLGRGEAAGPKGWGSGSEKAGRSRVRPPPIEELGQIGHTAGAPAAKK